jgi:hypothetical protein
MGWIIPSESQYIQGMERQLLIDTAHRRTGMVAEAKLNSDGEYLDALQSFCLERQWWWRKKTVALITDPTVAVYDMAAPTSPVNALDCQKIVEVNYFPTNAQTPIILPPDKAYMKLRPMFHDSNIQAAMEDVTTGAPQAYFMVPGSTTQIQITPIPDDAYRMRWTFWAVPNGTQDTLEDMIPLVPAHLQRVLMLNLQLNFLQYATPSKETQMMLTTTTAKYALELAKAIRQNEYADGQIREWKSEEHAIRSHS